MGTVVVNGNRLSLGRILAFVLAGLILVTALSACGSRDRGADRERLLAAEDITSIGVNAYLWQAALETLDFMPLLQANPNSGVIITDWRVDPEADNERVKVTVYIKDRRLRADALQVTVFRQMRRGDEWSDMTGRRDAARAIEEAIMVQARRIHLDQVP